ncbi:MAG: magnesium and cobalt transport protein CorA [Crocinitomicaceae bacterium]|nr:magnesium and cobalt transport protein CorA [Flavobacteriia bacterium]NDC27784.1 magnesium and cobalt transport protein CorA [Crocinitomicaceae bacterium]NDC92536.1 magnesium and cobalt transport protein CorA [Flavobacteriales bacterium]
MSQCQLYKYNATFYTVKKENSEFFGSSFSENELDNDHVAWLNFHGLDDTKSIEELCHKLDLDKLTNENIHTSSRRPKIEEYPKYVFFQIKSALPTEKDDNLLNQEQISFILGSNYLISFQEKAADHFSDIRDRIIKARGKIRSKGPDFLLFRMLEAIIDNYFEVLESITEKIEWIDERIHSKSNKLIFKEIEIEKRKLIELRKIVMPIRDITIQLASSDSIFLDKANFRYFSNLKSSCASALEEIDANKQILEGLTNLYYAVQGQRMNQIMKVLTIVSAIFIPLTFIVGVYGMNFENMPELKYQNGYFIIMACMLILGISLLAYFIKRGWLKREDE